MLRTFAIGTSLSLLSLSSHAKSQPVCPHDAPPLFADIPFETSRDIGQDINLVITDFNNDGTPDMAWLSDPASQLFPRLDSRSISIATSCTCGRFTETTVIDLDRSCNELAAGDFNADGNIDLAVNDASRSSDIYTLQGLGDSTFLAPEELATSSGVNTQSLAAHDLDQDGDDDLIALRGTFRAGTSGLIETEYAGISFSQSPIDFADLDNDGIAEAILADGVYRFDSELNVIGTDRFLFASTNAVAADWDQDGTLEIAGVLKESGSSTVLNFYEFSKAPDGTFTFTTRRKTIDSISSSFSQYGIIASDIDSDGWPDLIGSTILLRPDNPNTIKISSIIPYQVYDSILAGPKVAFADVNQDGTPDRLRPGLVQLTRKSSNRQPTWNAARTRISDFYSHVLGGDFNNDTHQDFFVEQAGQTTLGIGVLATNDVPIAFPEQLITEEPDANGAFFQHAINLDNDPFLDVVLGNYTGQIITYRNNGDQTFTRTAVSIPDAPTDWVSVDVADIDKDGDDDVVALFDNNIANENEQAEVIWFRNDNGTLIPTTRNTIPNTPRVLRILTLDQEGDGDLDIVASDFTEDATPSIALFIRDDDGTALNPTNIILDAPSYWLLEANIDNDPETEILVSLTDDEFMNGGAKLIAFDRDNSGAFDWSSPRTLLSYDTDRINEFLVADVNADKYADIIVTVGGGRSSTYGIMVFTGMPDGTFHLDSGSLDGGLNGTASSLLIEDLNGDIKPDVLFVSSRLMTGALQGDLTYPRCPTDYNADNIVDLSDIQRFIDYFLVQHPAADINRDTVVDLADIQEFVDRFLAGC